MVILYLNAIYWKLGPIRITMKNNGRYFLKGLCLNNRFPLIHKLPISAGVV
jgi:hypothetical protein